MSSNTKRLLKTIHANKLR